MTYRNLFVVVMVLSLCVVFVLPCSAQYREYYITGKVEDSNGQPLDKVKISLRDVTFNRGFSTKTNIEGKFKLAGLPHGIYRVTMEKEGFQTFTGEWKFEAPQTRMKKVDVKTIILVSESKVKEIEAAKEMGDHLKGATDKIREQDFDGAMVLLEKIHKEKPDDVNAIYLMGVCYFNKQKVPEAMERFIKVTELTPDFPGAYYQLGNCYMQKGDKDKALENYQKGLELKPGDFISLYNGGLILYEKEKTDEALDYFGKALELQPDSPVMLEFSGLCYLRKEDYAKAREYLEKAKAVYKDPEKIKSLQEVIDGLRGL